MIKDVSSKITQIYINSINRGIENSDTNMCKFEFTFSLSRAGIIFLRNGDCQGIDVAYKDYGYSAVEEQSKRRGIAWVLMDILLQNLKNTSYNIKNLSTTAYTEYDWIYVSFSFCVEINKYLEL